MQFKIILSLFTLLFVISIPSAFADVTITPVAGSGAPGCEESGGCFSPSVVSVNVGDIITFLNTDSAAHTFTAGNGTAITGEFDSSMVMAGDSYEWIADTVGEIDYFCMLHPWMIGTVIVQATTPVQTITSTILILDSIPSSIPLYDSISVSGILIAIDGTPISGKPVWIESQSGSGLFNSVDTITDSNGYFESVLSFTYDDDVGYWTVYAGFDGDNDFTFSYSDDYSLFVEAPVVTTTSTIITLDDIYGDNYDSPIFVTGTLTTVDGTPISGKPVWMQAENPNGGYNYVDTITDSNGYFESVMYFLSGDQGSWCVNAGFDGDDIFLPIITDLYSRSCFTLTIPPVSITPTILALDSIPSSIPLDYGPFLITGILTDSNGIPLSGKSIQMSATSDSGRGQGGDAITDLNGYFERELYFWHDADTGFWDVYVYFEGDSDYDFSSSVSRYITVEPVETPTVETSPITVSTNKTTYEDGDFLLVSGTAIPNELLDIWLSDSNQNVISQTTITADSTGSYSVSLETWNSSYFVFGEYTVSTWSLIDDRYDVSFISFVDNTTAVTTVSTNLTIDWITTSVQSGDSLFVSGTLTTFEGIPVSGKSIWISINDEDGEGEGVYAITNSNGKFETNFDITSGMKVSEWTVKAFFDEDTNYFASVSNPQYFTVESIAEILTYTVLTLDSIYPAQLYESVLITGSLNTIDGTPLSNKSVLISISPYNGGTGFGYYATTDFNGYFETSHNFLDDTDVGDWYASVEFEGTFNILPSWSESQYFTIDEPSTTTISANITLDPIPSSIQLYNSLLITGTLVTSNGIPLSGQSIWVESYSDMGDSFGDFVFTDSNGHFEYTLNFPYPDDVGNWYVNATFEDMDNYAPFVPISTFLHSFTVESYTVTTTTEISISTDKSSYDSDDPIFVSGMVTNGDPEIDVTIVVTNPNENVVSINQFTPSVDGTFTSTIYPSVIWEISGTYTVVVNYGSITDSSTFEFTNTYPTPVLSGATSLTFNIDPSSSTITEDYPVTFYGTLTTADGQYGIPNVTIYIKDDVTFGSDKLITTATTDNNGEFYTTWTATLRNSGAYDFYAVFNGNSELEKDRTTNHKVTIIQDTPPEPVSESEAGTLTIDSAEYEVSRYDSAEVSFSGTVFEYSQGSTVLLDVIFPDGEILEQNILVSSDESFSVTIFLDYEDPLGVYTINAKYRDKEFAPLTFTLQEETEDVPDYPPVNYSADIIIERDTGVPGCEIYNNCYSPYQLSVNVGDTVEWYNSDSAVHTVSQGSPSDDYVGGEFDSGMLMSGESFFHTFENGGTFDYFDMMHPWMMGIVQVNESVIVEGGPENAGALGSAHVHAGILVKIFGDEFDFSAPAYQIKSPWIHFEESDGDTIHRHATGVELEYLFNSLSIGLDDQCYVFPDGKSFCTNDEYSLKYFINEKLVSDIRNYVIQEDDEILIIFDAISSKPIETKTGLIFDELPKTVTDGELISFTGQLLSSNGTPLEGKTIYIKRDISFGSDDTARTVITNENGYFTAERSYTLNKGYDESKMLFYAKWDGDSQNNSFRTQNQLVTLVLSEPTTTSVLTLDTPPSQIKSGDLITFSGSLLTESGEPIVDKKIVIKDEDDFSGDDFIASAVTDNSGNYSVTVTARDWDPDSGATEVYAVFNSGTNYYTSDRTKSYDVIVSGSVKNTTITFDKLPKSILEGETVTFSGQLLNDDGTPIEGKTIYIKQDVSLGSDSVFATLTTDENGYFTEEISFTLPRGTENLGAEFYAKWDGDSQNNSFRTQSQMIIIKASDPVKNTTVTLDPLPNKITEGESITFSGQLLTTDGIPLEGRTIYIKDDYDFDTDSIIKKTTTDSNGKFSISWSATVRYSGSYDFYAVFEGEEKAKRDRSLTYGVYVTAIQSFEPIRVFSDESIFEIGDSLVIYGDATPNEELNIALMDSNENLITSKTIQVTSSGSYSTTLYNWKQSTDTGDYWVVVWSAIDERYDSFWVSFIESIPQVSETRLTLDRPPSSIVLNEPIVFSGKLQTIDGNPIKNANVIIATLPRTGGTPELLAEGFTDSSGNYNITWYARQTSSSGMTPVYAYYGGNQFLDSTVTSLYDIKIEKPSLSVFTEKSAYETGERLLAYGYGNPNDRINVELKSAQGKVVNSEYSIVSSDGNYHTFFNLDNLSNGQYTIKVTSALYAISDSVSIQVESKIVTNEIDITGNVHYNYNKIPLAGIKAVLDIGAQQHVDYADSAGNFEFENIGFNPQLDYTLHFEMTDGKSFNFVDGETFPADANINREANGEVISSKYLNLPLDNSKSTNHFSINLGDHLPYDSGKSFLITKGFDTQTKIVNFYSKVLNERPPIINIYLFADTPTAWYSPTQWDPSTNKVMSGYWQPRIGIGTVHGTFVDTFGMEYTHYVQDYAYKKMNGADRNPMIGNHHGFNNPSTADSWFEGVGGFMPAVIADWENLSSAGTFGSINLEENRWKPDSLFDKRSNGLWLDEEYSISTLLWDMYDSENEQGDNTTMRINQIWKLIKGFDSFQQHNPSDYHGDKRNIKYFKDFYDYLYDESNMTGDETDDLFLLHGIPQGWSAAGRP